ncbi:Sua5/YciO/YrdC/YwlC family protein [Rodentibacter caecimuris]|uniref:Sua5/YciO/YrdC/YwlC family protein n=1 Tax=Rodentibacter caecimuris TaxID=1796644 RepID=UPI0010948555|nr:MULTISPECIES: Sua5/YciO/YrdC/YwlC family protein [Pasteurellaceae]MCR1836575.1 Sua5/YciO/YrdC/YwlC family protein [Pasteurella caecimuris]MCU0106993.1 Sua5/YciO/YrdC/YwlC family protein [Pasteurella caecimuris]MCX2962397.1 Sua5/YciO/YrdC/YwlC family protein [Rodentibacter heylii]QIA77283.1 tRNA threonylcarbamoyladenosine biosynthesis protein RimN [Rodentibacter heylii]TGY48699.1 tRNA threonylcarbamoyladenosine biosynthesis protein RimN [Pasteurella caecimuris]
MTLQQIVARLLQDQVVAYPTEAVFGLGCNPFSESAVKKLLDLKQRPMEKGLILIAPSLIFLQPFIDLAGVTETQMARLTARYDRPITWVVPAKSDVSPLLTGKFNTIAVRLSDHPAVKALCEATGFALISTSANLTGAPPCRTGEEVRSQFGEDFPVLDLAVGKAKNPSEICDLMTNQLFRQG